MISYAKKKWGQNFLVDKNLLKKRWVLKIFHGSIKKHQTYKKALKNTLKSLKKP